jgi:uncharacterized small protein (DUF1192 family)
MTDAERMRRYRLKHGKAKPVTKPVTKPAGPDHDVLVQELARARARIADAAAEIAVLKAELARERKQREAAEAKHAKPGGNVDDEEAAAAGPMGKKVFKILLKLDDANDNTVLVAARTLVSNLKASGSDLRTLADSLGAELEKQEKAKPPPPPPLDWSEIEAAVTRYAADRATVRFNAIYRALVAEVPALKNYRDRGEHLARFIQGGLRRLGFTASSSGLTWSR